MKVKDLHILDRHYCVHADAYLVIGTAKNARRLPGTITGWHARGDETLYYKRHFLDADSAHIHFDAEMVDTDAIIDNIFSVDRQQQAVYDWEDRVIVPHGRIITAKDARAMIARVADDNDMPRPKLVWEEHTNHSEYDECDNRVHFGHRDSISLLHELAHALYHERRDGEKFADHSPGFVWTAIELYHRYAGVDLQLLITSAMQADIIGDLKSIRHIRDLSIPIVEQAMANDNTATPKAVVRTKNGPRP
ncbi:hypothetical protein [Micavibrio aeruginosavorus]|uniref:Uncharacterized protein n=1 Tax=Micavibrio aeruginosavorus EPB TaxID=349215 RepID=M4VIC8_9BACT|nr:hypothetical protein [Micavibrio aeruginosavorus]AGH99137.1 hypothetical protein A11S_2342 [Micavibrio aeruginosavorus EPB]